MYLKTLKLAGFKSFADRTGFEFEPGVSVVVGPNGTGKSNIVDAIAWVLGTRFTRALRTDRMEDVIFAGTSTRPSHSRAEVTVVLDNHSRMFPLDLDEISLTRRLFRGGASEYEINGTQCRLLDVQELLSDGGVGRTQHLIVGQGRLESILAAGGDQRRRMIEEAAGILKHQARKARALRRMELTDADLVRLHDITNELARRKRKLGRQAEAAARHERLSAELRDLKLWQAGESLRFLQQRRSSLSEERSDLEGKLAEARAGLDQQEAALAAMEQAQRQQAETLESNKEALAELRTVAARLRGAARVAQERGRGLTGRIEQEEARRKLLERESDRLSRRILEATEAERRARQDAQVRETDLQLAEDRIEGLPAEDHQEILRSLESAAGRDAHELTELSARREETIKAAAGETEQARAVEQHLQKVAERTDDARPAWKASDEKVAALAAEHDAASSHRRKLQNEQIAADARATAYGEGCPPVA